MNNLFDLHMKLAEEKGIHNLGLNDLIDTLNIPNYNDGYGDFSDEAFNFINDTIDEINEIIFKKINSDNLTICPECGKLVMTDEFIKEENKCKDCQ